MGIDKILNETRKAAKEYKKRTAAKTQQSAPVVEKPAPTINWHQMNVDRLNRDIAVGKQKTEELNRKFEYTGGETPTTIQDMALKPSMIGKFTAPKTQASPFAPTKENAELLKQLQKSNSETVEKAKKFFGEKENADWGYYLDRMNNVTRQEVEGLLADSQKRHTELINQRNANATSNTRQRGFTYNEEISSGIKAEEEKIKLYKDWLKEDSYNSLKNNNDYEKRNFYREKNGVYEDEIYQFLTSGSKLERDIFIMNDAEGNNSVYDFMIYMTEEERKNYIYLYNTKGKEDAREYYKYIEPELEKRADERVIKDSYEFGAEHPVLASAISRLLTPVTSALSAVGNVKTMRTVEVDENNRFTRGTRLRGAMDQGVTDEYIKSETGKIIYGVAASLLDNVVNALVSKKLVGGLGATPAQSAKYVSRLTMTLMSSEVMANGVIDAKEMGLNDADAITVGIARGVTEYLTGKWSIERILKEPTTVLKALRKATVAEGTEETFSNWINRVIDTIAYGDRNSITKAYNEQIENGASEKQAFFSTVWKIIGEDTLAFVGGALGGGLMTAGGMGVDITRYGGVKNYNKVLETRARWSQMSDEEVETEIKGMRIAQAAQALAKENTEPSDIALALSVLGVENPEKAAMAIVNFKENGTEMPEEYVSNPEFWDVVSTLKNKGYFRTNSEKSEIKPQSDGTNATESVTKPPESVTKPPESIIRLEVKADDTHPQYQVDAMVDSLLAEGKRQFDTAYEQETEAGFDGSRAEFLQRYNRYYLKGLNGGKLADADARYADTLSLATRKAAFKAGRADRNAALDAKYVKSNEAIIRDGGVMRNHNTEGLDNETVKAMDKLGKRFGVAVEIADSVTKADGTEVNGEYANGKIRINASRVSGNKLILAVAQHEIAHRVQELMPKQYQKLRDIAYNIVTKDGYSAEVYAKERGLDLDSAIDEVVCDFIARKDFALRVAEEDMSLAQKIKNWLKDILDTVGIKQYTDLERAYRAWEKAVTKAENTVKSEQRKGNTVSNDTRVEGEGEVKYSYSGENAKSIKEQLQTNANALNEMEVVAKTEYTNFNSSKKQVLKRVSEKFKKMGYSVERKGFGRIEISEKLINTGLNYLNDEAEYAAFDTIDKVLKHGISIEDRGNHKNREHGTITFAAPVEINGVRGNVAVVVKETKGHRYKTHRILMPNGSAFVLNEKTEATTDWMTIKNDGESQSIASAFKDNISQNNSIVNTNDMQNNKKNSEGSLDYLVKENERLTKEAEFYKAQMQRSKEFAPDTKKMAQIARKFSKGYQGNADISAELKEAHRLLNECIKYSKEENHSQRVLDYIEAFISDLQNSRKDKNGGFKFLKWIHSNSIKASMMLNIPVAINQVASYTSAAPEVGYRALSRALLNLGKVDLDLIARYTPLQWNRTQGSFDPTVKEAIEKGWKPPKWLDWMTISDATITRKLWKASEYNIRSTRKDLEVGSHEYYEAVAEVYNRVMMNTQPNSTVMERPGYLRADNFTRMVLPFMGEPLKNANLVYDSVGELNAKKRQYQQAKGTDGEADALKAYKKARSRAITTVTSQIVSTITFSVFVSAARILVGSRAAKKRYEDEEEGRITLKSWAKRTALDSLLNFGTQIPFASEVVDIISAAITGERYWGSDMLTTAAITGAGEAIIKFIASSERMINGEGTWQEYAEDVNKILLEISPLFGIPLKNIENLIASVVGWGFDIAFYDNPTLKSYMKEKYTSAIIKKSISEIGEVNYKPSSQIYDLMYRAFENGDKETYDIILDDMIDSGVETKDIEQAMKTRAGKDESFDFDKSLGRYAGVGKGIDYEEYEKYLDKAEELDINSSKLKEGIEIINSEKPYKEMFNDIKEFTKTMDDGKRDFFIELAKEKYTSNELDKKSYKVYSEKRDEIAQKISAQLKLDAKGKKASDIQSDIYKYADELALTEASNGDYEVSLQWVNEAKNARNNYKVSTGEFIRLYNKYGKTVYNDKTKKAVKSGCRLEKYLEFTKKTKNIKSDVDSNGKTISGSKQDKIIAAIEKMNVSSKEKAYYYNHYYGSDKNNPWAHAK